MFFKKRSNEVRKCPRGHILDPDWDQCPYCAGQDSQSDYLDESAAAPPPGPTAPPPPACADATPAAVVIPIPASAATTNAARRARIVSRSRRLMGSNHTASQLAKSPAGICLDHFGSLTAFVGGWHRMSW